MILLIRHQGTKEEGLWPFYWIKNKHNRWHVGQFPPQMTMSEFKECLQKLGLQDV
jgi:hypothetical protein